MFEKIRSMVWRECGAADMRALLDPVPPHKVIAFGKPDFWRQFLGKNVKKESDGGTRITIAAEPNGAPSFDLETYFTGGGEGQRNEIRVKTGKIRDQNTQVALLARNNENTVHPDKEGSDDVVIFLIHTDNDRYHLRGILKSRLTEQLATIVGANRTGYIQVNGMALSAIEMRVWEALIKYKNVLLYGPPGTGKTRMMLSIKKAFEEGVAEIAFNPHDFENPFSERKSTLKGIPPKRKSAFVTFHQSLSYETFILGMRPVPPTSSGSTLSFSTKDGIFIKLAEHALGKDSASLLLIDEINRGNVADILGELITIIEQDKRLGEDGKPHGMTVSVTLPLKPESKNLTQQFQMPYHQYILASMNSLDRSVAPLDSALRRRFRLIRLVPDLDVARQLLLRDSAQSEALIDPANTTPLEAKSIAIKLLDTINANIMSHWGPEFQLGHSYILGVGDPNSLIDTFAETIFPQLFELYRDRQQDLAEILGVEEGSTNGVAKLYSHSQSFGMEGAVLEFLDLQDMKREDAIRRLYYTAFRKVWEEPPNQQA